MIKEIRTKTTSKNKDMLLETDDLKKAALVLRALNHKLRQQILSFIHKKEETNVSDIYAKLRLEQSVTSQHLAILRKSGFVNTKREGQNIYYSLNYTRLAQVHQYAKALIHSTE